MPPDSSPGPHATPDTDALAREVGAASRDPSSQFGRYLVLSELGHGGMGVVYRAWDPAMERLVAIKTLTEGPHASPQLIQRFVIEARSAARLQHPGIIGVHEVGEHQGIHFIAMDLVAGQTLKDHLAKGMASRASIQAVLEVARALAHAHAHGIVHRDVKPDNVVVNDEGRAILMDFGLAKDLGQGGSLTATGQHLGTPSYMAPEQIDGRPEAIGPAADIYALGATLYRALCGRPPFTAASSVLLFKKVLLDTPPPLRQVNPEVPANLEALVLRCLEKDPANRYPSAETLADDLGRVLEKQPLSALAKPQTQGRAPGKPGRPASKAATSAARAARGPVATPSRLLTGPTLVIAATVGVFGLMGLMAVLADRRQDEPNGRASSSPASGAGVAVQVDIVQPQPDHLTGLGEVSVVGRVTAGQAKEVWVNTQQAEVRKGEFQVELSLEDGSHQLAVSLERAGEPLATLSLHVDTTAPLVAVTAPSSDVVTSSSLVLVRGTVEDAHLETVQLSDGTPLTLAEDGSFEQPVDLPDQDGEVTVELVARDRVGNETRHPIRVAVDRSPPRIVLSHGASLASRVGAEVTLQGRVEDAHPAVLYVDRQPRTLEADGGFSVTLKAVAEGTREVILQAEDTVGQRSPEQTVSIVGDDTPPRLEVEAPLENLVTQEPEVAVRGHVTDAHGVGMVTVQGQTVALASDGAFSTSVTVAEGETRIEVVAKDTAGNRVTLVRLVTGDTSPPTITLEPDLPADHYGRSQIKITGHMDEPGCTLTMNGEPVEVEAGRFKATTRLVVGENTLVLEATDRAGNVARQELKVYHARRKPKLPRGTWWEPTKAQIAYAKQNSLPLWFKNELGMRFVLIPPGDFLMGSLDEGFYAPSIEEQHPVTLTRGFYMAATEVTNDQSRGCPKKPQTGEEKGFSLNQGTQPLVKVSWENAWDFCDWLNGNHPVEGRYRLPTEAEWEYACRAATTTVWYWGDDDTRSPDYANVCEAATRARFWSDHEKKQTHEYHFFPADDAFRVSASVASFKPNRWGLYDMIGNVAEWCSDWYDGEWYQRTGALPRVDPQGPPSRSADNPLKAIRGGSWMSTATQARSAGRWRMAQTGTAADVGIRLVVEPRLKSKR